MQRDKPSPLGSLGHFRFQMSLVLEDLPAGRARNYLVKKREFRGVARMGPAHSRWTSLSGVVALYREPGDRLRGSFRLQVAREVQQLLGGWSSPDRYLMMGTFEARPDVNGHGRQIAEDIGPATTPATELSCKSHNRRRPVVADRFDRRRCRAAAPAHARRRSPPARG